MLLGKTETSEDRKEGWWGGEWEKGCEGEQLREQVCGLYDCLVLKPTYTSLPVHHVAWFHYGTGTVLYVVNDARARFSVQPSWNTRHMPGWLMCPDETSWARSGSHTFFLHEVSVASAVVSQILSSLLRR